LRDEAVGHELANLFQARIRNGVGGLLEQRRYANLKRNRQTSQRGERGRGFVVLNLGDVGARHLHAQGKLTLAESAALPKSANGESNLQMRVTVAIAYGRFDHGNGFRLRLLPIEAKMTFSTEIVGGPELDQVAVVAP